MITHKADWLVLNTHSVGDIQQISLFWTLHCYNDGSGDSIVHIQDYLLWGGHQGQVMPEVQQPWWCIDLPHCRQPFSQKSREIIIVRCHTTSYGFTMKPRTSKFKSKPQDHHQGKQDDVPSAWVLATFRESHVWPIVLVFSRDYQYCGVNDWRGSHAIDIMSYPMDVGLARRQMRLI